MDIKISSEARSGSCYFAPNICSLLPSCLGLTFLRAASPARSSNADRASPFSWSLCPLRDLLLRAKYLFVAAKPARFRPRNGGANLQSGRSADQPLPSASQNVDEAHPS